MSSTSLDLADIARYAQPRLRSSVWQILNTFIPYGAIWVVLVMALHRGYPLWIVVPLIVLEGAFLVRVFIIFHDCCHGSFFASQKANRILGYVAGILTFTSFAQWQRSHAYHHSTVGDLDKRGVGDVWTMTLDEYLTASRFKRFEYRSFRNPVVMLVIGPAYLFLVMHRFFTAQDKRRERISVLVTDAAIALLVIAAGLTIGLWTYLAIQLSVSMIAGMLGIWLFYVQHQFTGVYWARHGEWEPMKAALDGSSFLKLPGILQWFTGSIGLHHIHHVQQRIPNYALQRCYDETPVLHRENPLTLRDLVLCLRLKLWDEKSRTLIGFREVKAN